jgi:hypothetical protein
VSFVRLLMILSGVFFVSGCSIHPIQEEVTGVKTVLVVDHIRCEARNAVIAKALQLIRRLGTPYAIQLADDFEAHPDKYADYKFPVGTDKGIVSFYNKYIDTGLALEFTFDNTEANGLSAQVDPIALISKGTVTFSPAASSSFTRESNRKFIVSDTFSSLFRKTSCAETDLPPNYVYPISGSVGLKEVIDTFIELNEKELLIPDTADTVGKTFIPAFADTLTYTTLVSGSVNPKVTLMPAGHGLHLMDASLMGSASRTNKHTLVVGLAFSPRKPGALPTKSAALPLGGGNQPLQTVFAKTNVTSLAEIRAIQVITQQRMNTFYDRAVVTQP